MEGFKKYRHDSNPKEKEFHDKFIETFNELGMSRLVFPSLDGDTPIEFLNEREIKIVISTIQWLGSPVGQSFLNKCGFIKEDALKDFVDKTIRDFRRDYLPHGEYPEYIINEFKEKFFNENDL